MGLFKTAKVWTSIYCCMLSSCHSTDKNAFRKDQNRYNFSVCGPAIGNSLSPDVRTIDSYHSFLRSLKRINS